MDRIEITRLTDAEREELLRKLREANKKSQQNAAGKGNRR